MNLLTQLKTFYKVNEAHIFTGATIGGVVLTGVEAYKSGLEASDILKEYHEEMDLCDDDDTAAKLVVKLETAKKLAPVLAKPIIFGGLTGTSAFMADRAATKKIVALGAAYAVSEKALKETNFKMDEILGKKKSKEVREEVVKEDVVKNPPIYDNVTITGHGDQLCKDMFSGRYFRSSPNHIGMCINKCAAICMADYYVSLNELYEMIGLERTVMGDEFGYNTDDLFEGSLPIEFASVLLDDNTPVLCMDYRVHPRMDFWKEK